MRSIETSIRIDATPEAVWEALTDFEAYAEWNPLLTEVTGEARQGARLTVRIDPPGLPDMRLRPRLIAVEKPNRLAWRGRLLLPGVFDGHHEFRVEPEADGVRFVQREEFSGVLVPALLPSRQLERGFREMDVALKERVEGP